MEARVGRLESDVRDMKSMIASLDARTGRLEIGRGILAVLLTAYACGLAGLAILK